VCVIGIKEGATLAVDGRSFKMQGYENGFYMGGCLFDNVTKDMRIYKEEIFGPVLSVVRAEKYDEALALCNDHEYGNGVAIFTRDGDAAHDFASKVQVGMVGINVPIPVPLAYYTFGGWKRSAFGDLNQHGPDSIRFYTKTKTPRPEPLPFFSLRPRRITFPPKNGGAEQGICSVLQGIARRVSQLSSSRMWACVDSRCNGSMRTGFARLCQAL
jgi:hypothetical protein